MDDRAAQGGNFDLGDRNEKWDSAAAEKSYDLPTDGNCFMWRNPDGDPATRAAYKLPFVSKSGGKHAVWGAITAIAAILQGGRGGVDIPDADKAGVKAKIESYYAKARKKYNDDSIQVPWSQENSVSADNFRFAVAPITHVDVRDATDSHGFWTMSGYAAVFSTTTTLYDGRLMKVTEEISPNFFDRVLREQRMAEPDGVVHFNLGHDMNRSVAATDVPPGQPGSLQLSVDPIGLRFLAKVPQEDPDGIAMAAKMRSGVLRQASFAFTIAKEESVYRQADEENGLDKDMEHIVLQECKHLYDVCATPQGAYATTVSGLRSLAASLGQPEIWTPGIISARDTGDLETRQPSGDEEHVSPADPGDGAESTTMPSRERRRQALALKRKLASDRFDLRKGYA